MSSLQWPWLLAERVTPTLSSCLGWAPLDFPSDLVHWTTLRRQLSKAQVTHMVLAKFWGAEVRKLLGGELLVSSCPKLLFRDRKRCDWLLAPALLGRNRSRVTSPQLTEKSAEWLMALVTINTPLALSSLINTFPTGHCPSWISHKSVKSSSPYPSSL